MLLVLYQMFFTSKYIDGLVQDCSNSSALAMELLQSCTEPLIYYLGFWMHSAYIEMIDIMSYKVLVMLLWSM